MIVPDNSPEPNNVPMWLHRRDVQLAQDIAELKTGQRAIMEHLKTLNGSVARHEKEIAELRTADEAHRTNCPWNERADGIESSIRMVNEKLAVEAAKTSAEEDMRAKWEERLAPMVRWLLAVAAAILLMNANNIMSALKVIK